MTAYLVVGAESSGTKLMTSILVRAGCQGTDGYPQEWDAGIEAILWGNVHRFVWRRSIPYAGMWPDLYGMVSDCRAKSHFVQIIWMTRDWHAAAQSQVKHGHVPTLEAARANLQIAHSRTASQLIQCSPQAAYVMVNFESLITRPRPVLDWVGAWIGLPLPDVEIRDENAKWLI
jgi:hypothetical protein